MSSMRRCDSVKLTGLRLSKQAGLSMFEMLLVIAVVSILLIGFAHFQFRRLNTRSASTLGNVIAQYVGAVEQRVIMDKDLRPGKYTGIKWLQGKECGGSAPESYLPCGFNTNTAILKTPFVTNVEQSETSPELTATVTIGPIQVFVDGKQAPAPVLAGEAITAARSYFTNDASSKFTAVSTYQLDKKTATITVNVFSNAAHDPWLRIDGKNKMEASITYDENLDPQNRQLVNVGDIQLKNSGDATVSSDNDLTVSSGSDSKLTLGGGNEVAINANSAITLNSDSYAANTSGNYDVSSSNGSIDLTAQNGINLNSQNSTIAMDKSGVNINTDGKSMVYLGQQDASTDQANVVVNDLKIKQESDSSGNPRNLTDYLPHYVHMNTYKVYAGSAGKSSLVPIPQCAQGGHPKIEVIAQDYHYATGQETPGVSAKVIGNYWQIVYTGTELMGLANTYCDYNNY